MKLLVFAQIPPPVHGQSIMVRTLVEGLENASVASGETRIEVHHVNIALSRDAADIGHARIGKFFTLCAACLRALWLRVRLGIRTPVILYYVPAPGKRAAIWRDWMAMAALRPFFTKLVLHWHAAGLASWLSEKASAPERRFTHLFLGRVALSIVLAPELADDALALKSRRICIVPNGLDTAHSATPAPSFFSTPETARAPTYRLLYLSACSREKGLFLALDALEILLRETRDEFFFTIAGAFTNADEEREFNTRLLANPSLRAAVRYTGLVDEALKHSLYADADVFVFPTHYAHEAQPLVLIEAMAHDLAIVTTRWRAISSMLPSLDDRHLCPHAQLVAPDANPQTLAVAIRAARAAGSSNGVMRAHYEKHFTRARHLAALAAALRTFCDS